MNSQEITERMNKLDDFYLGSGVSVVLEWVKDNKECLGFLLSQDHKDELSVRIGEAIRKAVNERKQR